MNADHNCIFCKIAAGELPSEMIYEDDNTVAFLDINPATRGHSVVIPRSHSQDLGSISGQDLTATILTAQRVAKTIKQKLGADGINLLNSCGADAWQTVFHFHIHVIPRYKGDPLRLPWDPRPVDTEELAELASKLRS